ncbi:hypothetical protein [Pleionea sediminis]|uniref:hypothetical protein n=1 Tax=Pleionea sediminis TaxID=2569479 RepID=UPI0011866540|nr:hypothetical protein [Pleionea sediminis]
MASKVSNISISILFLLTFCLNGCSDGELKPKEFNIMDDDSGILISFHNESNNSSIGISEPDLISVKTSDTKFVISWNKVEYFYYHQSNDNSGIFSMKWKSKGDIEVLEFGELTLESWSVLKQRFGKKLKFVEN